jgi:osmoprotectant transport system permease protein
MNPYGDAILVHLALAYSGFLLAVATGIPLAAISLRSRSAAIVIATLTGIGQAIPIFALVAFMVPLVGIGFWPSVLVIFITTLMPIVRSTYAGISSIEPDLVEAARGIGLTRHQTVLRIRIPLSLHAIFSGVKFSSIIANGVAVVTVFIGSGGLGTIVLEGLARFYMPEVVAGIMPAVFIALAANYALSRLEYLLTPLPLRPGKPLRLHPYGKGMMRQP